MNKNKFRNKFAILSFILITTMIPSLDVTNVTAADDYPHIYHHHTTGLIGDTDDEDVEGVLSDDYISPVQGGCYTEPVTHKHTGSVSQGGGCYTSPVYHVHEGIDSQEGGCYTTPVYHVHYGSVSEGGGCYTIKNYHVHTGSPDVNSTDRGCYTEPVYHEHIVPEGATISTIPGVDAPVSDTYDSTGCFNEVLFHTHQGNENEEGGCYTVPVYHTHNSDCGELGHYFEFWQATYVDSTGTGSGIIYDHKTTLNGSVKTPTLMEVIKDYTMGTKTVSFEINPSELKCTLCGRTWASVTGRTNSITITYEPNKTASKTMSPTFGITDYLADNSTGYAAEEQDYTTKWAINPTAYNGLSVYIPYPTGELGYTPVSGIETFIPANSIALSLSGCATGDSSDITGVHGTLYLQKSCTGWENGDYENAVEPGLAKKYWVAESVITPRVMQGNGTYKSGTFNFETDKKIIVEKKDSIGTGESDEILVYPHRFYTCEKQEGEGGYIDRYDVGCGKIEGETPDGYIPGCGMTEGETLIGYALGCGKETTDIDSYSLGCGKTEETIDRYALSCGMTTSTVIRYARNCGKNETTSIDGYACTCGYHDGQDVSVKITINHRKQNIDDDAYGILEKEVRAARYVAYTDPEGNEIVYPNGLKSYEFIAPVKGYHGFTAPEETKQRVKANGSTVWNYNYDRLSYGYTVNHYTENIGAVSENHNTDNYTLVDTDVYNGSNVEKLGKEVTPVTKEYTGFTTPDPITEEVLADDALVINYYYPRNTYTYTRKEYEQNIDDDEYTEVSSETIEWDYDDVIDVPVEDKEGFTSPSVASFNMPANNDKVVEVKYDRNSYNYNVEYWLENVDGDPDAHDPDNYTMDGSSATEYGPVKYGKEIEVPLNDYTGFEAPVGSRYTVEAGTPTLKMYYPRKYFDYTIRTMEQDPDDASVYISANSVSGNGKYGTNVTVIPEDRTGFITPAETTFTIDADNEQLFDLNYDCQQYTYTIEHWLENIGVEDGAEKNDVNYTRVDSDTEAKTALNYNKSVPVQTNTYTGFGEPVDTDFVIGADNNQIFRYYYPRNQYKYVVKTNEQTIDQTGYVECTDETEEFYADYGDTISIEPSTRTGFITPVSQNFVVPANDDTVIDLNYDRDSFAYTIEFWKENIGVENGSEHNENNYTIVSENTVVSTGVFGKEIVPDMPEYTGFTTPAAVPFTISANDAQVYRYYYPRNQYRYVVRSNIQTVDQTGYTECTDEVQTLYADYGDSITITPVVKTGFVTPAAYSFTVPANNDTVIDLNYDRDSFTYTIECWIENIDIEDGAEKNGTNYSIVSANTIVAADVYEKEVTPVLGDISGFTTPEAVPFNIAADNGQIYRYYYSRNQYPYYIKYYEQNKVDSDYSYIETKEYYADYGKTFAATGEDRPGFSAPAPEIITITSDDPVELEYRYTRNIYSYKVFHYKQKLGADPEVFTEDNYELIDTDELEALYDVDVTPERKTYFGFESPDVQVFTIPHNNDGYVAYYYPRQIFNMVVLNCMEKADSDDYDYGDSEVYSGEYGSEITITPEEYEGFVTPEAATFKFEIVDHTNNLIYRRKTNTVTVRHYKQADKNNTDNYTLADTKEINVKFGAEFTAPLIEYPGYLMPETQSVIVPLTGETVVDYYYNIGMFELRVSAAYPAGVETLTENTEVYFGDEVPVSIVLKPGYTFDIWASDSISENMISSGSMTDTSMTFIMPPEDIDIVAVMHPDTDTRYTVEHYVANIGIGDSTDVSDYSLAKTDVFYGVTDSYVTPPVHVFGEEGGDAFEGFIAPEEQTITVSGNGSTILRYLYRRDTFDIVVNHYLQNPERTGYILEDTVTDRLDFGGKYTGELNEYDGFDAPESKMIQVKTTGNVIDYYYDRTEGIMFSARYFLQRIDGTYSSIADEFYHSTGYHGENVLVPAAEFVGFEKPEEIRIDIDINNENVVNYYYHRNSYVYTVNHYVQTELGGDFILYTDVSGEFTALYNEVVTPPVYEYFAHRTPLTQSLIVTEDESRNVINYYYPRLDNNVIYIDVDEEDDRVLGTYAEYRSVGDFVNGSELGEDTGDNVYHEGYKYSFSTSGIVEDGGLTLYRMFTYVTTEFTGEADCEDSIFGASIENVRATLLQNGVRTQGVDLGNRGVMAYTFPGLPKYDSNGIVYRYDVALDYEYSFYINGILGAPEGAKMSLLYYADENGDFVRNTKSYTAKANNKNKVSFSGLIPGYYMLTELSAPDGYVFNKTEQYICIVPQYNSSGKIISVSCYMADTHKHAAEKRSQDRLFYVSEEKTEIYTGKQDYFMDQNTLLGSITIYTVSDEYNNLLPGAVYDILDNDNHVLCKVITDDSGIVEVKDLEMGQYFIKESTPPKGYNKQGLDTDVYLDLENRNRSVYIRHTVIKITVTPTPTMAPTPTPRPSNYTIPTLTPTPTPKPTGKATPTPTPGVIATVTPIDQDAVETVESLSRKTAETYYEDEYEEEFEEYSGLSDDDYTYTATNSYNNRDVKVNKQKDKTGVIVEESSNNNKARIVKPVTYIDLDDEDAKVAVFDEPVIADFNVDVVGTDTGKKSNRTFKTTTFDITEDMKVLTIKDNETLNMSNVEEKTIIQVVSDIAGAPVENNREYLVEGYIYDKKNEKTLADSKGQVIRANKTIKGEQLNRKTETLEILLPPQVISEGEYTVLLYVYDEEGRMVQVLSGIESLEHTFQTKNPVSNIIWIMALIIIAFASSMGTIVFFTIRRQKLAAEKPITSEEEIEIDDEDDI